jgi:hypothetical protein
MKSSKPEINEHPEIFEPVYLAIEKNFPLQFRSVDSEYEQYKMEMPQDPLCVLHSNRLAPDTRAILNLMLDGEKPAGAKEKRRSSTSTE